MKLTPQAQQEIAKKGTIALEDWARKYKERVVYDGGALDDKTKLVNKNGIRELPSQVGSFVVIRATSHQEAAEIFLDHPHFSFFPGDGIEVTEIRKRD